MDLAIEQLTNVLTAISHPTRRAIIKQLSRRPARFLDVARPFDTALNSVTKHLKLLNALIKIRPDYVEAWNRRATIYFLKNDYGKSIADIREVLRREPRHFGALSGLGVILEEIGDDKHALEVFRRAVEIYPRIERIPELVKTLQEKVEGRDI